MNNELLDWGPDIQFHKVGACPIESFEYKDELRIQYDSFLCKETEPNAICVGTRDGQIDPPNHIYPMRFCKRGFYEALCEKSSDTIQFSGTIESPVIFSLEIIRDLKS